jgi:hypothetical protein
VFIFVASCVGSGLSDELIARSEESYRTCDLKTSTMRWPRSDLGCNTTKKKRRGVPKLIGKVYLFHNLKIKDYSSFLYGLTVLPFTA